MFKAHSNYTFSLSVSSMVTSALCRRYGCSVCMAMNGFYNSEKTWNRGMRGICRFEVKGKVQGEKADISSSCHWLAPLEGVILELPRTGNYEVYAPILYCALDTLIWEL